MKISAVEHEFQDKSSNCYISILLDRLEIKSSNIHSKENRFETDERIPSDLMVLMLYILT